MEPFDLNLRHLAVIATAAEIGSISGASETLNLSQPALTQAVGKVEAQLGHTLFYRQPGGVVPTEAGQLMVARIERAIAYIVRGGQETRHAARLPPLPHVERRVTLGQLRALVAVDGAGSYALASATTGLSQPALHRASRDLERMLEVSLLVRHGRTVQPTVVSQPLLRFARLARAELQAGLDELAALLRQGAGRIRLGTLPLAQAVLLPKTLSRFAAAYPDATLSVVEAPFAQLLTALRQGDIDLMIGAMRPAAPTRDVVQEALFEDETVIVARAGHPLFAAAEVPFSRLLEFPWALAAADAPVHQRWDRMFAERGMTKPNLGIECGAGTVLRGLLLDGDWLTMMSRDQFLFEERAGLLREINLSPHLSRSIAMTTRDDWRPTALQRGFLNTLRETCRIWTSEKAMGGKPFRYV
jgi:DNA-binding transcriptional LysR family regulator